MSPPPRQALYLLPLLLALPLLTLPISHPLLPTFLTTTPPPSGLHILPTTYGGTGNQLYFLLEAVHLARATNSTLLLPPSPRVDRATLAAAVRLAPRLPARCRNAFDHVIRARRAGPPRAVFTARELAFACPRPARGVHPAQCGRRALRRAKVHHLLLPLSRAPSPALRRALRAMSGCVLLDGHSYDRAGEPAQEALHSYLHYLAPVADVAEMAARYHLDVVVHLRYDEHECFRKRPHREGLVCVRVQLSTQEGVVRWVKPHVFVAAVAAEIRRRRLRSVYLAFSPHVPVPMAKTLERLFRRSFSLVPPVRANDREMENLVERQLATNAKLFVGDFGSTWSGTVYYKRRTLSKETVWACRLLELCDDLGHYRFEGILREPEWFESVGIL